MDCSSPGSSVHGISQARILEHPGGHFLLQGIFPDSGMKPVSPALAGEFFITEPPRRQWKASFWLWCSRGIAEEFPRKVCLFSGEFWVSSPRCPLCPDPCLCHCSCGPQSGVIKKGVAKTDPNASLLSNPTGGPSISDPSCAQGLRQTLCLLT